MHSIHIADNSIIIRNLCAADLETALPWLCSICKSGAIAGVENIPTQDQLRKMLSVGPEEGKDFFAGIYLPPGNRIIGVLKGVISDADTVWINLIAINPEFRRKGYGSNAVRLLQVYLQKTCGISKIFLAVIGENSTGQAFWKANGFCSINTDGIQLPFQGFDQQALLMCKKLGRFDK